MVLRKLTFQYHPEIICIICVNILTLFWIYSFKNLFIYNLPVHSVL